MKLLIKQKVLSKHPFTVKDSDGAVRWIGEQIDGSLWVLNAQGDRVARIWKSNEDWVPILDYKTRRVEVEAEGFAFAFQEQIKLTKKVLVVGLPWQIKGSPLTKRIVLDGDREVMWFKPHMLSEAELFIEDPQLELRCVCVALALEYLNLLGAGDGPV